MKDENALSSTVPAIILALIAYFLFSIVDVSAKYMGQFYNVHLVLALSNIIGFTILLIFILWHRGLKGLIPRRSYKLHAVRSLLMVANSYFIVKGLTYIGIAEMYGLIFASPFIMTILSVFILKESVGWHRWLAIFIGFAGILIILRPGYAEMNIGLLMGVGAAIVLGANAIVLRLIGKDEYTPLFPFYAMLFIIIFNVPFAVHIGEVPGISHLPLFIVYGLGIVLAVAVVSRSYVIAPATSVVAPFVYSSIIWGMLFGYFIFGDVPDKTTYLGAGLIIAAGIYMIYREREYNRKLQKTFP